MNLIWTGWIFELCDSWLAKEESRFENQVRSYGSWSDNKWSSWQLYRRSVSFNYLKACWCFLAHLTWRFMWAVAITWCPSSVRKHFNLLLENHWSKWDQTWQECSFAWSNQVLLLSLRSVIQHGCQGP